MTYLAATAARSAAPTYAEMAQAREARAEAAEARKRKVEEKASEALGSPRLKASDTAKQQARAKVQSLLERLRLLKKMLGGDPKQMARALAQVTKELREAVKAYRSAGGQEMGMTGDLARGVTAPGAGDKAADASDEAPPEGAEGAASEAASEAAAEPATTAAGDETKGQSEDADEDKDGDGHADDKLSLDHAALATAPYEAVATRMRETLAEGDRDFIKQVKAVAKEITTLLERAKMQAKGARPDKATDKSIQEADEEMKALNKDLEAMERDIQDAAPTAGIKLSIAT